VTERPILTAQAMRDAEQRLIDGGTSVETLMERAGACVAEAAWRMAGAVPTLILCGPGNNGGDGYVVARLLRERGVPVEVFAAAPPATEAARAAAAAWGGALVERDDASPAMLVIDAMFGKGLKRPLEEGLAAFLFERVAAARWSIAVDLPSGVATDDGAVMGQVPPFSATIALGAMKPAHRLLPAAKHCGLVVVGDIGLGHVPSPALIEIGRPVLAAPGHSDNKYTRGKVLVIDGAMSGAAALMAGAAQRAGAGYVELAGRSATNVPHALVQRAWDEALLADDRVGAVVIGPGLGRDADAQARLDAALASGRPLVLDADALTLVGQNGHERLEGHVLTPHWGEFTRLFDDNGKDRLSQARSAAAASGAIILLKGADTIVAHPDGRAAIAPLAPAWLASAGTGDVLAGIAGAMVARGLTPFDAAKAAVWLHGEAARLAGSALIADDLITHLPAALEQCL
jgi:ADP-dependent NAD(P)H-hydrate dehydratase / NAD(P)H-hydrate epimerase